MRTLVINPAHGVAGDMLLAGVASATESFDQVGELFRSLHERGWCTITFHPVKRASIRSVHCQVNLSDSAPTLSLEELHDWSESLLRGTQSRQIARAALDLLGFAEAEVHGGDVRLHELGSIDTLVDVVGTAYVVERANVDAVQVMPVGLNFGSAAMAHGQLPLPGPAVLALFAQVGIPVMAAPGYESVTPTGAALLGAVSQTLTPGHGVGTIVGSGYGAGTRDPADIANVCQVLILDDDRAVVSDPQIEEIGILETYLDDVSGEVLGGVLEDCIAHGALDGYLTPATGKKSRPGVLLTLLVMPSDVVAMLDRLQRSLGTPGVRFRVQERRRFNPHFVSIVVQNHPIRVKVTSVGAKPEYADLVRASEDLELPFLELRDRVMAVYRSMDVERKEREQ